MAMRPEWRQMINHFLAYKKPYSRETINTFKRWVKNDRLNQNLKNKLQNVINEFNRRPDPYRNRFLPEFKRLVNANNRFRYLTNRRGNDITVYYTKNYSNRNAPQSYVNFSRGRNNKSAYLNYGYTNPNHRQSGIGKTLRNFGVRAARAAGLPLYQYSINLNRLGHLPSKFGGKTPISGYIMEKLGAVKIKGIPSRGGRIEKKAHAYMIRGHPYETRAKPK